VSARRTRWRCDQADREIACRAGGDADPSRCRSAIAGIQLVIKPQRSTAFAGLPSSGSPKPNPGRAARSRGMSQFPPPWAVGSTSAEPSGSIFPEGSG